jgi:hypothetical protein
VSAAARPLYVRFCCFVQTPAKQVLSGSTVLTVPGRGL